MTIIHRRQTFFLLCAGLLVSLGGCWRHSSITSQEEGKSYLRLIGNLEGSSLCLDGGPAMELEGAGGKAAKEGTLWEVLPGRHLVELFRNGDLILRRDLYFGLGQTLDLAVPR